MAISSGALRFKMPANRALAYLTHWAAWGLTQKPRFVRKLPGGLNSFVFLIESSKRQYVVKVFDLPKPEACRVHALAARHQLAPKLLYVSQTGDYCVMDYLKARPANSVDHGLVSDALAQLHSLDFESDVSFSYHHYYETYLQKLGSRYHRAREKIQSALQAFIDDQSTKVLSHNDLVRQNCLVKNQQLLLIDWEFAQINNPWFDLASTVFYLDLAPQQSLGFIDRYWQQRATTRVDNDDTKILNAALCAVIFLDIVWQAQRSAKLDVAIDPVLEQQKFTRLKSAYTEFENA